MAPGLMVVSSLLLLDPLPQSPKAPVVNLSTGLGIITLMLFTMTSPLATVIQLSAIATPSFLLIG